MNNRVEKPQDHFRLFTLDISNYLEVNRTKYEDIIQQNFMERAPYLIGPHCDPVQTRARLIEMFKLNTVGKQVEPGTKMEQRDEGFIRRLVSTDDSVILTREHAILRSPSTTMTWSLPYEDAKEFSRFETSVVYSGDDGNITGSMNLFFDIPDLGTDRFQLLVTYDGLLPQLQEKPFNCYTVGGTFSPDGNRLQPGTYDLG